MENRFDVTMHKHNACINIFVLPAVGLSVFVFPLRKFLERNVAENEANVSHN